MTAPAQEKTDDYMEHYMAGCGGIAGLLECKNVFMLRALRAACDVALEELGAEKPRPTIICLCSDNSQN